MAVKAEVALYILKKLNLPNATKVGLVTSWFVFTAFDIDARVKRAMYDKSHA